MKRSDLLNILKDEIVDIRQDTTYSSLEWAETLLSLLENQGMLPPARWREKNWNELGITYSDWIDLGSKVNEWEREDETK